MKRIGIAAFTQRGKELAARIGEGLQAKTGEDGRPAYGILPYESGLKDWCRGLFETHCDGILFVGAAGIAVRSIAPFLRSKTTDPAVLVIDEAGQYVISLLSGHIGGANRLALEVAALIGAEPVITTATDVNGKFAVDVFAKDNHLQIGSMEAAKKISAAVLRGEPIGFYCEGKVEGALPPGFCTVSGVKGEPAAEPCADGRQGPGTQPKEGGIRHFLCICGELPAGFRERSHEPGDPLAGGAPKNGREQPAVVLHLAPKPYVLGIGCRKGKSGQEIADEVQHALSQAGISMDQVFGAATIDLKKGEQGLLEFCRVSGLCLKTYPARELQKVCGDFSASEFVRKTTGVDNVCERAALCMAGAGGRLVQKKYANNGVTAAVAARDWSVRFG